MKKHAFVLGLIVCIFTLSGAAAQTLVGSIAYLPVIFGSRPSQAPQIAGCGMFPADNIWNTPIDGLPVAANSSAYINAINEDQDYLHPDFGTMWEGFPIGIPYNVVPDGQSLVNVTFRYASESDPNPYLIPSNPLIEGNPDGNGDRHILVLDSGACRLYELYAAHREGSDWYAGSGAIYDLSSHALRPDTWTSADAAGLPMLPGLVRYDEVASGEIRHAIRFTSNTSRAAHIWPARHHAAYHAQTNSPPMGLRVRLKAAYDISGFAPEVRVILQAMKTYGLILADNGGSWYISGVPDARWDDDTLVSQFEQVHGSDFEVVDASSLMIDPDSGQAR